MRLALFSTLGLLLCVAAASAQAGGNRAGVKPGGRTPKIREVVEMPEDYVGREFTYSVRLCTHALWITRASSGNFFMVFEDLEGTQLPAGGIGPDSTVKLMRFILKKEDARMLIDRLSASQKYEARITFRIETERGLFGDTRYIGRISAVELMGGAKAK